MIQIVIVKNQYLIKIENKIKSNLNIRFYLILIMELYKEPIDDLYWKTKYMPKNIESIDIDENVIYKIKKWLNDFEKNKLTCIKKDKPRKQRAKKINTDTIDENIENTDNIYNIDNIDDLDNIDNIDDLDNINEDNDDNNDNNDNNDNDDNKIINQKIINDPNKSCVLVSGSFGSGKTSTVISILNSLKYTIYQLNLSKINNYKNIDAIIEKSIFNKSISNRLNNINDDKKILVIDSIESITSNTERALIINLIKYNENKWLFPIILIANNKHNKLLYLIKKISYEIKLPLPSKQVMENILCKICIEENIRLNDEKVLNSIIEYAQNDIRGLITMLQSIKNIYNNKIFDKTCFNEFIKSFKMKDIDYHIYDGTQKFFFGYDNINNVIRLFEMEKTVMPLMIQQHYIDYLKNNNINEINKISKTLAYGDIIENYIYDNNIYDIRDVQAFFQCIYPSYILTNKLNPNKLNYNAFSANFIYPCDLNKTSIRFINFTKNISQANKIFKNMEINDYLFLNKIIRGLIYSNKSDLCNEYLNKYNCSIQILESVLKIDKINGIKYNITTKLKKKILAECNTINDKIKDNKKYKDNKKQKKHKKIK